MQKSLKEGGEPTINRRGLAEPSRERSRAPPPGPSKYQKLCREGKTIFLNILAPRRPCILFSLLDQRGGRAPLGCDSLLRRRPRTGLALSAQNKFWCKRPGNLYEGYTCMCRYSSDFQSDCHIVVLAGAHGSPSDMRLLFQIPGMACQQTLFPRSDLS